MMQFFHSHGDAILIGCIFANGVLAGLAFKENRGGWLAFHVLTAIACAGWFL